MRHNPRRTLFALSVTLLAIAMPARAELRTESEITYTADVDEGSLDLESRLVLTNLTPDVREGGTITRFFFSEIRITVPDSARSFRASSGGQQLSHRLTPEGEGGQTHLVATIDLGRQLLFQESMEVLVEYEIPGDPPRSATTFRINPAYINFAVFGWGDPGRVTVNVVTPSNFELEFAGADWDEIKPLGDTTIHTVSAIDELEEFVIHVTGYDDSALVSRDLQVDAAEIVVRAWPDDEGWSDLVASAVTDGLPALVDLIGLEWEVEGQLPVNESAEVSLSGYGGWYLQAEQLIELSEWAEPHVVLHELSHVWFNQDLFVGRWINEGLAEVFSRQAVVDAGLVAPGRLRLEAPPTDTAGVGPLNDWVFPDPEEQLDPDQTRPTEEYGYAASQWVMQQVTDEIGFEAMADVLAAADEDLIAYRGEPEPEQVGARDDWRRLLDLIEEIGDSETAGDLFAQYVTDEDLTPRARARAEYDELVTRGEDWLVPFYVRQPISAWEFEEASSRIEEAHTVLEARFEAEANTEVLGMEIGDTLETTYESATETLGEAMSYAGALVDATGAVVEARRAVDADRNLIMEIGLVGADPEHEYGEAVEAMEVEDFEGALVEAHEVVVILQGAERSGQFRLGAGLLLVLLAGSTIAVVARRRSQRPV